MTSDGATSHGEDAVHGSGETRELSATRCTGWDNGACEGTPYCPPRCPRFFDKKGHSMLCRRYRESDFRSLVEMYEGFGASALGLPPTTRTGIEQWLERLIEEGPNLVAVSDDRVIGHIGIVPNNAYEAEIVVFVREAYQNQGVGSELVTQAIAHASAEGYDTLTLLVSKGNRAAVTVYRNVGFEVDQRTIGEIEMHLPLDEHVVAPASRSPVDRE